MLAKSPLPLRLYFVAQLINTVLLETCYGRVSPQTYELLYVFGLALILGTMGDVIWRVVPKKGLVAAAAISGIVVLLVVSSVHGWNVDTRIVVAEGFFLSFAGTALALRVPQLGGLMKVYAALVVLWFVLALFDFAFAIDRQIMERMNLWLPTICVITAMSYMGWKLREYARINA
jgi:hypothetical protein